MDVTEADWVLHAVPCVLTLSKKFLAWLPLGLLLSACLLSAWLLQSLCAARNHKAELEVHLRRLRQELSLESAVGTTGTKVETAPVFPATGRLDRVSEDIPVLAQEASVQLLDVSFTPVARVHNTAADSVEISVRLRGRYEQVKAFSAKLLDTHEGVAMKSLSLRRARPADAMIDADLLFTFYSHSGS